MHKVTLRAQLLAAARADGIPVGTSRLWFVRKYELGESLTVTREGKLVTTPAGSYTQLFCATLNKLHEFPAGELVMDDTPGELNKHLDFMLRAHGDVLISGLGLGCVTRGCLANPNVRSVTVIEREPDVLYLVAPHMTNPRLTIVVSDALRYIEATDHRYDCAWHDLWSNPDNDEQHLQRTHLHLLMAMRERVKFQGAWEFPRLFKRLLTEKNKIPVI
jgi:hypothetical protein